MLLWQSSNTFVISLLQNVCLYKVLYLYTEFCMFIHCFVCLFYTFTYTDFGLYVFSIILYNTIAKLLHLTWPLIIYNLRLTIMNKTACFEMNIKVNCNTFVIAFNRNVWYNFDVVEKDRAENSIQSIQYMQGKSPIACLLPYCLFVNRRSRWPRSQRLDD